MSQVHNVMDVPVHSSLRGLVFLARRVKRHDLLHWLFRVGVAGVNGPLRRVMEDGSLIAGWNQGGNPSLTRLWKYSPYVRL